MRVKVGSQINNNTENWKKYDQNAPINFLPQLDTFVEHKMP